MRITISDEVAEVLFNALRKNIDCDCCPAYKNEDMCKRCTQGGYIPSVNVRQIDDDPYQTDMDDAWEQAKRAERQTKVFGYDAYKDIRETLVNLTVKGYTRSMIQTVLEQME